MKRRIWLSVTWVVGLKLIAAAVPGSVAQAQPQLSPTFPPHQAVAATPGLALTNLSVPTKSAPPSSSSPAVKALLDSPVATIKAALPGTYVSPWLLDIVKLAQAGIKEDVMLTFVDSAGTFNLDADQIIFLRDLGVSDAVINAMIEHDFDLLSGVRQVPANLSDSQSPTPLTFVRIAPPKHAPAPPTAAPASPRDLPAVTSSPSIAEDNSRLDSGELAPATGDELETTRPLGSREQTNARGDQGAVWPVRLPYAVQLTDPIIVVPGAERFPNVVVIHWFH